MPDSTEDRRDQTPVVLARLETIIASIKDDVSEMKATQRTFVTHDRMELEIAARSSAMGQVSATLAEHIRHAEQLEIEGRLMADKIKEEARATFEKRVVPLERAWDELQGGFKTLKFLIYVLGSVQAVQVFLTVVHR